MRLFQYLCVIRHRHVERHYCFVANILSRDVQRDGPSTVRPRSVTAIEKEIEKENININNKNTVQDKTLEIGFNTFWELYPKTRKAGKDKPRRKFYDIINKKQATIEEVLQGTERYANSREVQDGYGKEPYSWLLNERWKLEYEEVSKSKVDTDWSSLLSKVGSY